MGVETEGSKRPADGMKSAKTKGSKSRDSDMPKSELSAAAATGRLDGRLIEKAVQSLLLHHAKATEGSKDLLGNETVVQVQLGLEVAPQRSQVKPIPLNIPHGFLNGSADNGDDPPSVCLIVKQESKPAIKELLEKFPKELGCVKKVLGLQSLRTKYHDFAQRRELLHSYDVFMADDRILPMLTSALGKIFFKAKQQPIPVDVTRKTSLPFNILKALKRTHFSWSRGTCVLVVAGRTTMDPHKLVQNIVALVPQAVDKLPRKWANLRSVSIKTPSSMALPVYNKTPQELMEIARLAELEPAFSDSPPPPPEEAQSQHADRQAKSKKDGMKEKSPLLQALQKQKQKEVSKEMGTAENSAAEGNTPLDAGGKKEKKRKSKEDSELLQIEKSRMESEDRMRGAERKEKSRKKAKKEGTDTSASSSAAAPSHPPTPKETKTKEPSHGKSGEESSSFVVAKKYTGSKPGFVFKMGPRGLGYYRDVKPVVDRMALEAIMRMASTTKKSGGGGGGGGKSSKHHHGHNKRRGGGGRR